MAQSRTDTIDDNDLFIIWKTTDVDYRQAPVSAVVTYMQDNLTFPGGYVRQYSSPAASPFTLAITSGNADIHLILTPTGTMAVGTLTLPLASGCLDGQRVLVNTTAAVTTLNIGLNGAVGAVGAPTTIAANGYFTLTYDAVTTNWYRVG